MHTSLDAAAHFAPTFDEGLSNHLPMALHALHRLGASAGQRAAFTAAYAPRLAVRAGVLADAPLADWPAHIGQRAAFEPLRAHMAHALATQGLTAVLRDAVPRLLPGAGGDAFHGLIRTAHALDAGHAGELAQALAYWAASALVLRAPAAPWPEGRLAPQPWLHAVLALPRPAHPDVDKPRIALRMAAWATAEGFDAAATALAVDAEPQHTVDALARLAARLYAQTRNFTALHLVTSLWALRSLGPWLPDRAQAVRTYAVAVAAGLHAARLAPAHLAALDAPLPARAPWAALRAAACASTDDHAAKFVWACACWHGVTGDGVFAAAATQAVGEAA